MEHTLSSEVTETNFRSARQKKRKNTVVKCKG